MTILRSYLAREIYYSFLIILVSLLGLFTFFSVIEELDKVNNWSSLFLLFYVHILKIPILGHHLIPIAILIGFILSLSKLSKNNALLVFRSSGLSGIRFLLILYSINIPILIGSLTLSEIFIPLAGERIALCTNIKAEKKEPENHFNYMDEYWFREFIENYGIRIISISKIRQSKEIEGITIYEFDKQSRLCKIINAKEGFIYKNLLNLRSAEQISFASDLENLMHSHSDSLIQNESIIGSKKLDECLVKTQLDINNLTNSIIKHEYMSILMLIKYINYLKNNELNADEYITILWKKILHPLSLITMASLSAPISFIEVRRNNLITFKVFSGIFLGMLFFIINQFILNFGTMSELKPWISESITSFFGISSSCLALFFMENQQIFQNFSRKFSNEK